MIEDKYLSDPKLDPINKTLLAFASYNAGPNRVRKWRAPLVRPLAVKAGEFAREAGAR